MSPAGMNYTRKLGRMGFLHCPLLPAPRSDAGTTPCLPAPSLGYRRVPCCRSPHLQRPSHPQQPCSKHFPEGNKLLDAGTELDTTTCALPACAQACLCWANLLWYEVGSCIAWFVRIVVVESPRHLGLGGALKSSLVKYNKNPSSQRGLLLKVMSPSPPLPCCCP